MTRLPRIDVRVGVVAWAVARGVAHAAEPTGTPVVLDVTREIVFSNAELVSMGGAGAAFATGGVGMVLSPAAPANRRLEAVAPVQTSLVFLQTGLGGGGDLANVGEPLAKVGRTFSVGLAGGYRDGAGGVLFEGTGYRLDDVWVGVSEGHASAALSLLGGDLTLGAGPRLLGLRVTSDGEHHDYLGTGVEAGAIVANQHGWNYALTLRSGVWAGPTVDADAGIAAVRLPPQLLTGIGWTNSAYLPAAGGVPVRFVADVVVDAPVPGAVSLEGVIEDQSTPRGGWYTVSPRLGAEVDVWRNRFRLRAGTYLEPSRTASAGPRPHVTGGGELRLFRVQALHGRVKLDLAWQVGADYAPRYFRGAWLGINIWQQGAVGGTYRTPAPGPAPS